MEAAAAAAISDAKVFIDDITGGQENIKISFINMRNFQTIPKSVSYIPNNILVSDSLAEEFESIQVPCNCGDICGNGCSCTFESNTAYFNRTLSEEFLSNSSKPIVECSILCSCSDRCSNRLVQNGIKVPLQVFMTEKKGFGVQTLDYIPKLTFVCEYAGEIIDIPEAEKRMKHKSKEDPNYIYVLKELSSESNLLTIIDPTFYGNVGRYLNHSCSSNLVPVPIRANSMIPRLALFTKRDIMPYEELTYNYGICIDKINNSDISVDSNTFDSGCKKCYCNSNECLKILPYDVHWLS